MLHLYDTALAAAALCYSCCCCDDVFLAAAMMLLCTCVTVMPGDTTLNATAQYIPVPRRPYSNTTCSTLAYQVQIYSYTLQLC
jgi:hypothetical protein